MIAPMNPECEKSPMRGNARDSNDEAARSAAARSEAMALTPASRRSLVGAAVAFAGSMARFAASGFKTVDEPMHELRMSHCATCSYLRGSQCSLCRCFVGKKAWLPGEDCPVGRWES